MNLIPRFYDAGRLAYREGKTARYIFALARELEKAPNFGDDKAESYMIGFFEEWMGETRSLTLKVNPPLVGPSSAPGNGDAS